MDEIDLKKVKEINFGSEKLYVPADVVAYNPKTKKISLQAVGKGMFEDKNFSFGTREIAKAVSKKSNCTIIIGGGDTIAAVDKFGDLKKITYVCTGGGAMLEFLNEILKDKFHYLHNF